VTGVARHVPVERLARWRRTALIAGVAGALVCLVGVFVQPAQFFRSYLIAFLYWLGIGLGCLGVGLLHNMTGGAWGRVIRSFLGAGMRTLPLLALLFVPIALGMGHLYEWSHPEVVAADELLQKKSAYLNVTAVIVRAAVYFAIWIGFALTVSRLTERARLSRGQDEQAVRRLKLLSAPGILLYVLTMTFASVDWAMSLDPHWFSTIYGVLFIVGQALSAFAFVIVLLAALRDEEPLAGVVREDHFHDLGNLLLAFLLLWAYVALSQLIIIWSGNLPEEIPWYIKRFGGGWQVVGLALAAFHFIAPFFVLLSRIAKRRAHVLARVALALLVMRAVDLFWIIAPEFREDGIGVHWLDPAAFAAVGGVWLFFYFRQLAAHPLVAHVEEAGEYEHEHTAHGTDPAGAGDRAGGGSAPKAGPYAI
jgi:hypothetical protein